MIRLDKFLTEKGIGSRSQVKQEIKKGLVRVNGEVILQADYKFNENKDVISYQGTPLLYQKYQYYMLHKPAGVVTSTKDNLHRTVMDLCPELLGKEIFPVGRLDIDTEGLLLLTNDGDLAHKLLSPRKKVPKTYYVELEKPLTKNDIQHLEEGVDIGEEQLTLPASVEVLQEKHSVHITITEGKFHQVKRMFHAVKNEVCYLKRISMGTLYLDQELAKGEYRALTKEEIEHL